MTVHLRLHTPNGYLKGVGDSFTFPGGEHHLRDLPSVGAAAVWVADVRGASADDLVKAALWANVAHQRQMPFVLMLPYLPAARADRGEPEGARVYAELINSMNPQQVIGIDAHSPMIGRYLRNLTQLDPFPLLLRALQDADHRERYDGVISPDKGAAQRAYTAAHELGLDFYRAEKVREFDTGKILGIEMKDHLPRHGRYLVVDDICDGGGTFMGLAKETGLHRDQLGLWVTHGIFSGRAYDLREHYRHIYTTDSHPGHNRVGVATVIVPTETYMLQHVKDFSEHALRASCPPVSH
ncbi:hypothetical protein A5747_13600 [Mycobacterium sp. IS-836]|uniref:hypothetical protein n=1 Tax=Mycobacterium sp. IS-836 TaxID=1834160 RepID=UPI00096FB115|nr:hypothetical protein [Mycobacterium sp. IS-836]OMC55420.1 hypothetical protein A5747_13600 [Mycobacterium sp. IS-836]